MSNPVPFLMSIGQAMSAIRFYANGHPARDRATRASYEAALELLPTDSHPRFTFLEGDAAYHERLIQGLRDWEWATRLQAIGIQRLEFSPDPTFEEYEGFLFDVADRLAGAEPWDTVARQLSRANIEYGGVGFRDADTTILDAQFAFAGLTFDLGDEINAIEWIHDEVRTHSAVPVQKAEAVVRRSTARAGPSCRCSSCGPSMSTRRRIRATSPCWQRPLQNTWAIRRSTRGRSACAGCSTTSARR